MKKWFASTEFNDFIFTLILLQQFLFFLSSGDQAEDFEKNYLFWTANRSRLSKVYYWIHLRIWTPFSFSLKMVFKKGNKSYPDWGIRKVKHTNSFSFWFTFRLHAGTAWNQANNKCDYYSLTFHYEISEIEFVRASLMSCLN